MNISATFSAAQFAKTFDCDFTACKLAAKSLGMGWSSFNHSDVIAVKNYCEAVATLKAIEAGEVVYLKNLVNFNDGNSERTVDLYATPEGFELREVSSYHDSNTIATHKELKEFLAVVFADCKLLKDQDLASVIIEQYMAVNWNV